MERTMKNKHTNHLVDELNHIYSEADLSQDGERCMISASPELREKIQKEIKKLGKSRAKLMGNRLSMRDKPAAGKNDGLIYPGNIFPLGTPLRVVSNAAADRAPLSGVVRVAVILAEFSDRAMGQNTAHFEELFFSEGILANGSVKEYFAEVTNGAVDIQGAVVGPYELPLTLAEYANGNAGTGSALPNARTMARDAAIAANPHINFGPYDNSGDGFVDAFIVIHAGPGGEVTGNSADIWSHKWVLQGGSYNADGTSIYAYLTVPEDARIGVCCHELGHLLFGFPDLYDTDGSSEGVGNWCLMGGGSWNGGGDIPAHPSAWCKAEQGWVTVINQTSNSTVNIADVKDSQSVYRLWKNGAASSEYFLVENRQKTGFDARLPGDGLLIWHIDESMTNNSNESHYKVGLEQADANRDLENGNNRGDSGDTFPGAGNNTSFDNNSTPNSKSYGSVATCVAITNIAPSAQTMQATLKVRCISKNMRKDFKDIKEARKEFKEKENRKDFKEKEFKEKEKELRKDFKEKDLGDKSQITDKRPEKPITDKAVSLDKRPDKFSDNKFTDNKFSDNTLSNRVDFSSVEQYGGEIDPFIDQSLRPDLCESALSEEDDLAQLQEEMQKANMEAKHCFDSKPKDS